MNKQISSCRGDTIIEVLISIMVAAFAIGSSYAIASQSLKQAISARERDQALNIMESQVSALKFREQQTDATTFDNTFTYNRINHFCLNENSAGPTSGGWGPISNNGNITSDTPLTTGSAPPTYASGCVKSGSYYVDISTQNMGGRVPTVYTVNVRWERLGGGPVNEAKVYYRF